MLKALLLLLLLLKSVLSAKLLLILQQQRLANALFFYTSIRAPNPYPDTLIPKFLNLSTVLAFPPHPPTTQACP
jgi:hypothetical protein